MHCGETRAAGPRMAASRQITTLLGVWGGEEPAVIAGDMNLQPDEEDVELFLDAGLESVQEEIGDPCEPTATEPDPAEPCDRVDWIFVTPDVEPSEFEIVETRGSDLEISPSRGDRDDLTVGAPVARMGTARGA